MPETKPTASEEGSDPYPNPPNGDDPRLAIPELLRTTDKPSAIAPPKPKGGSEAAQMGRAWATAMDFVFTVLAGAVLGWLFDRWRQTSPTGSLVGLAVGFVIAFVRIVRATQAQERAETEKKKKDLGR